MAGKRPNVRVFRKGWVRVTDRKGRTANLRVDELMRLVGPFVSEEDLKQAIRQKDMMRVTGEAMKKLYPPGQESIADRPNPLWSLLRRGP